MDQYCWGHGGFLAELKSEDVDLAIDKHLSSDEYYWIGATDVAMEGGEDSSTETISLLSFSLIKGTFKWAESHQAMDYYNWWEGQVILACDWLMATILTCHWSAHQWGQWRGLRLCAQVQSGVSSGNTDWS